MQDLAASQNIQRNLVNSIDRRPICANLLIPRKRAPNPFGVVLVHLGLQIGLNFVPATKTEPAFAKTTARQAVIFVGRQD
jgi:hypothetical protein